MIGIIDYGLGNLFSLSNALKFLNERHSFVSQPEELKNYSKLILPGVGAFPEAVKKLQENGMFRAIQENQKPLLGICLGMQLLFSSSEEFGFTEGLNLIPGRVVKLTCSKKIPHMGWNSLQFQGENPLLNGVKEGSYVYFVHSYHAETEEKYVPAVCDYGQKVTAVAAKGNVFGTQFHPEKSGEAGIQILQNFIYFTEKP